MALNIEQAANQFFLGEPTGQALKDVGNAYMYTAFSLDQEFRSILEGNFMQTSPSRVDNIVQVYERDRESIERAPKSALVIALGAIKGTEALYLALMAGAAVVKTVNALNGNNDLTTDQITQHVLDVGQAALAMGGITWLQEKLQPKI